MSEEQLMLLFEIRKAAVELAGYASYSEIVGAIHHNQSAIRKGCDEIFEINRKLRELDEESIDE